MCLTKTFERSGVAAMEKRKVYLDPSFKLYKNFTNGTPDIFLFILLITVFRAFVLVNKTYLKFLTDSKKDGW